jgi:hypothetical protein
MMRSYIVFALILIASALLINSGKNADTWPKQVPSPHTAHGTESKKSATGSQQNQSASQQPSLATEKQQNASAADKNNGDSNREQRAEVLNAALTAYTGELANYTELLVFIGFLGVFVAFIQVASFIWSAQEQIRPRIKVRSLTMVNDLLTEQHDKAPFRFSLMLFNQGGSGAKVISGNFTVIITRDSNTPTFGYGEPAYRPPYDWQKGELIPAGPDSPISYEMDRSLSYADLQDLVERRTYLHVYGFIFYRSRWPILRRPYRTAFCRRYESGIEDFTVLPNSGRFEFAD